MSRQDALLRLHKSLMARRDELRKRLGGELNDLRNDPTSQLGGDAADQAFDTGSEEVASQLAELESRELHQIEKALARLKQGSYGLCEGCVRKIPILRLNALPFSTTCIECQREMEISGGWSRHHAGDDWGKVSDSSDEPRDHDVNELEIDFTK